MDEVDAGGEGVHVVCDDRDVWPDNRGEPVLECKGLAPIASEETAVGRGFEETEVDPGDEESELDEHKGGGAEEDDEDVGDEEVDAGEGLDTKLNLAQELHLMLRDKLGERDEEADLEPGHAVVRQAIPTHVSAQASRLHVQCVFGSKEEPDDPAEAKGDEVGADDGDAAEAEELACAPYALEVPAGEGEGDGGDECVDEAELDKGGGEEDPGILPAVCGDEEEPGEGGGGGAEVE